MKTITKANIILPVAALILAALATPAAAQTQVPLKGTFQGSDAVTGANMDTGATGNGTHLGRFKLTQKVTIDITNFTDAGSARWEGANGDAIETTVIGFAGPSDDPDHLKVTERHTITGGTGRFAGAQGSFTVERLHKFEPSDDGTHVTFGRFEGTITPPGAAK